MKKILYIAFVAVAALTACRKEDVKVVADGTITVTTSIGSAETRFLPPYEYVNVHNFDKGNIAYTDKDGEGNFKNDVNLGMYVINTHAATETAILSNADFLVGASYYWQDMGAPKLRFAAYYPKAATVENPAAHLCTLPATTAGATGVEGEEGYLSSEQNQVKAYVAADLLVATDVTDYTADPQDNTASLIFKHATSKVVVNIENMKDEGTVDFSLDQLYAAKVTLTAKNKFTVDLTKPYTAAGYNISATDDAVVAMEPIMNMYSNYDDNGQIVKAAQKVFLIAPQTLNGKVINIEIDDPVTVGKKISYSFSLDNKELKSNQKLTLKLSLGLNEIKLTDFTITAWDNTPMDGDVDTEFGL